MRKPSQHQRPNSPYTIVLFTLLFLLFTATFSSRSQSSSDVDDLRYHLPNEHILMLHITANQKQHDIPVVRYAARQPITKGVSIIIGDIQPGGTIDAKLLSLTKTLPDWGWNTLLVMPKFNYLTSIIDDGNNANELNVDTREPSDSQETQIDAVTSSEQSLFPQVDVKPNHLQAPDLPYSQQDYVNFIRILTNEINNAFTQGAGYRIIYAKGQSASAVIDLMSQQDKNIADALVINNPYWPNMNSNQLLAQKLAKLPIPVLDLISLSDNIWAKDTINARRIAAKVGLKSLYRQRAVFDEQLSKALVSWTYYMGW